MSQRGNRNRILWVGLGCFLAAFAETSVADNASTGPDTPKGQWTQIEVVGQYTFQGDVVADKDLSGIACISDKHCLVGADEGREVQVVEMSREARTLRIVETLSLLRSGSEIDIEGIAAEGDCYYIVGSHGISKKRGDRQNNRCSIFRLKVDPQTGRPSGTSLLGTRVPASVDVASLAGILRADPILGPYFGQPLQQKGVNIEGLAVRNGRLFVGLRNPNLGGSAFVLEVPADQVFGNRSGLVETQSMAALHPLRLGEGLGIREIVAAQSCFLIIAGNAGSEPSDTFTDSEDYEADRDFFLFTWSGKGSEVHKIGRLPDVAGKAEAMTILEEAADHITVLILFDGAKRGRPTICRIQ